jgi:hypothetical protein
VPVAVSGIPGSWLDPEVDKKDDLVEDGPFKEPPAIENAAATPSPSELLCSSSVYTSTL